VLRWRFLRFASPIAAFVLLLALTACMRGPMVAAPAGPPQPPVTGPGGPPPGGPLPPGAGGPVKVAVLLPLSGANAGAAAPAGARTTRTHASRWRRVAAG